MPVVGPGAEPVDGSTPEFFGHVSFLRSGGDDAEGPTDMLATADFTDVTAADNPDWEVDLNDDVVGEWRADGGRGGRRDADLGYAADPRRARGHRRA